MEDLIVVEKARYAYEDSDSEVLRGITLRFRRGEFVAILGHNGSGKSTLAKLLNGVCVPTSGTVTVAGIPTSDEERLLDVRRHVGMVFQNPDNQIVAAIVEEDVAFGLENLGVEPDEMRKRVDEALKAVGMYEYREHEPHKLSGGQKQRVAIAGIIAMRPDCVVLDEPTAMLDPRGRTEVMRTIQALRRDYGITIILITHEMDEAVLSDRVIVMDHGLVRADGTPREVFSQVGKMRAMGLDVPQSAQLADLLRQGGIRLPEGILTEDECVDAIAALFEKERK